MEAQFVTPGPGSRLIWPLARKNRRSASGNPTATTGSPATGGVVLQARYGSPSSGTSRSARSSHSDRPRTIALTGVERPEISTHTTFAPATTWFAVTMFPSGLIRNPEPDDSLSEVPDGSANRPVARMKTTAASRSSGSLIGGGLCAATSCSPDPDPPAASCAAAGPIAARARMTARVGKNRTDRMVGSAMRCPMGRDSSGEWGFSLPEIGPGGSTPVRWRSRRQGSGRSWLGRRRRRGRGVRPCGDLVVGWLDVRLAERPPLAFIVRHAVLPLGEVGRVAGRVGEVEGLHQPLEANLRRQAELRDQDADQQRAFDHDGFAQRRVEHRVVVEEGGL